MRRHAPSAAARSCGSVACLVVLALVEMRATFGRAIERQLVRDDERGLGTAGDQPRRPSMAPAANWQVGGSIIIGRSADQPPPAFAGQRMRRS
jgi:hypothetical protein